MNLAAMLLLVAGAAPLTPVQQQQVARLEHVLMAPCCYTQTIDEHKSEIAEQMRHEVEAMVAAGKTDQQIKDYYRARYGETILVVPEGRTGRVAYGVPVALAAIALMVLLALLRRGQLRRQSLLPARAPAGGVPVAADSMIDRIRREVGE